MKVLLINTPYTEVYSKVPTTEGMAPPLGLAYLASYIREHGHEVQILDAEALQIRLSELYKHIANFDVVGVGSMTPSLKNTIDSLGIVKKVNPECTTVMGGPHLSAIPVETLNEYPVIDVGVVGEGEVTFLELVDSLENGSDLSNIKGIVYRDEEKIKLTKRRELIENLDELPFLAYDLLPMEKYRPPAHHTSFAGKVKLRPFSLFITSRGCPFDCTFCASKVVWGKKVRFRSAENVLEEIDLLVNDYDVNCLEIADDNFTMNKKRMNEILDGLIEREYDLHFNCLSRVDMIDEESLIKLKEAGVYLIRFGVESGSQKVLDNMNKQVKVEQIRKAFELTKKAGIPSSASMIIGHPGETKDTFEESLKLVKEIEACAAHFFIAIPIVGTELYKIAKQKNLIVNPDWQYWVQIPEKPVLRTESLSTEDLLKLRRRAYRSFYLRFPYIFKTILRIRTFDQIKFYLKGFSGVLNLVKK